MDMKKSLGMKTSKPAVRGFTANCEQVISCSNKKLKEHINNAGIKFHLCSSLPCAVVGAQLANDLHVTKYATVPQDVDLNVTDLSQLDPFFRCLNMCTCCFGVSFSELHFQASDV